MPSYVLALDQGTTSSRAILFDRVGRVVRCAQKEFAQSFPKPGWVEHDPEAIWASQIETARQATQGIAPEEIAAVGVTNQRETTLLWDRETGTPVCPAIVWQDRRTAEECDRLRTEGAEDLFRAKTGLVLDSYFSGTKLAWILANVPGARERAEAGRLAFGTIDTFLIWRLTGGRVHVTDPSNASRTLLYDIRAGRWCDELLRLLGIPPSVLPEIVPSSVVVGTTTLLGGEIPIAGIAGDQQAATFGQVCFEPGTAKSTYGTGCFLLLNTGPSPVESRNNLLSTVAWSVSGTTTYALEGSVFVAGAAFQWIRDQLGLVKDAEEAETLARSVSDTEGVYLVPAFVGLGAPYWDPYARGTMVGITRGTSKAHVVRATLESVAYQCRDVLEAMRRDSGLALCSLRVDGGAARNDFLMQFQADLLGVPVVRPRITETTALGAAYLAGLATGFWKDAEQIAGLWGVDRVFEPKMPGEQRDARYSEWLRAVERSRGWALPV